MGRLGQRAEPTSPGGYKVVLPPPMSMAHAVSKYGSVDPAEEGEGSEGTSR